MDFVEATNIDLSKESEHWWIRTRFQYIDKAIEELGDELSVLEVGCGTGQNLVYLRNDSLFRNKIRDLTGVDLNLPPNFKRNDLCSTDMLINTERLIPDGKKYDFLLMMDVIEHVQDPVGLIKQYSKYLKAGGRVLISVPAFQSLWSRHDILLHHVKRYNLDLLRYETNKAGIKPILEGYIFSVFFPVVFLLRKLFGQGSSTETDLKLPPAAINKLCIFLGIIERKLGNPLPFGTSVFGIYERD